MRGSPRRLEQNLRSRRTTYFIYTRTYGPRFQIYIITRTGTFFAGRYNNTPREPVWRDGENTCLRTIISAPHSENTRDRRVRRQHTYTYYVDTFAYDRCLVFVVAYTVLSGATGAGRGRRLYYYNYYPIEQSTRTMVGKLPPGRITDTLECVSIAVPKSYVHVLIFSHQVETDIFAS